MSRLDFMAQDLREGIRRLTRHPRFTLLAAGTLALGLATSTAVFSYVNAYARPFPGVAAHDLHQVWFATEDEPWDALSHPDFLDLLRLDGDLFSVTGFGRSFFMATVRRKQVTEVAVGQSITRGFFTILGIEMSGGRGFSPADDLPGATPTTVLSHEYWVSRYGADPDVVGQTILLNNEPYAIVGVAGPEFLGASAGYRPHFWLPFQQFLRVYRARSDTRENRESGSVLPIVRLMNGVSVARASDALQALARGLDSTAPLAERTRRFVLEPATWISPGTRNAEASTTRIMMGVAAFLHRRISLSPKSGATTPSSCASENHQAQTSAAPQAKRCVLGDVLEIAIGTQELGFGVETRLGNYAVHRPPDRDTFPTQ